MRYVIENTVGHKLSLIVYAACFIWGQIEITSNNIIPGLHSAVAHTHTPSCYMKVRVIGKLDVMREQKVSWTVEIPHPVHHPLPLRLLVLILHFFYSSALQRLEVSIPELANIVRCSSHA